MNIGELVADPAFFPLVVIPILIFIARVADVTLGTMRIIFVSRGLRILAPAVAFFEILIWLVAIGQIFQNLTNVANYIAYAAGFAVGNYVGILMEERLAMGISMIRIITQFDSTDLLSRLKLTGFKTTVLDAKGKHGDVKVIFAVTKRKDISRVIQMVQETNPNAFYTIEDIKTVHGGVFGPVVQPGGRERKFFRFSQKGK
ncbi:MAG: DUF2179 domain-containing protein [Methanomicrobiaceae archaeon]|nr:DUF2179 domain-containing protein [Methanomicrobiaceae archaeon]